MSRVSTEIKVIKGEPFVLRSVMENSIFSNVLPSFHPSDTQIQSLLASGSLPLELQSIKRSGEQN